MIDTTSNYKEIKNYHKFLDNNINACSSLGCMISLDYEKTILHLNGVITINQYQRTTKATEKYYLIYDFTTNTEKLYEIKK